MESSEFFDEELEVDFFNMLLQTPDDGEDEECAFKDYLCDEANPLPKRQRVGGEADYLQRPVVAIRSNDGIDSSSSLAAAAAASANPGSLTGGAVAEVGPRPDFSKWTTEDDITLWNSMEAGYAFEALARQAMPFSQRYTVKELRERWRALLYDPVVSAAATARMHAAITKRARQRHAARQNGQSIPAPPRRRAVSLKSHYRRLKRQHLDANATGVHNDNSAWPEANGGDLVRGRFTNADNLWLGHHGEVQDYMQLGTHLGGCFMPMDVGTANRVMVGDDGHGKLMYGEDGHEKMMYGGPQQMGGGVGAVRPPPFDLSEVSGAPPSQGFDHLQLISPLTPNEESSFSHMFSLLASGGVGAVVGAVEGKGVGGEVQDDRFVGVRQAVHDELRISHATQDVPPPGLEDLRGSHDDVLDREAKEAVETREGGQLVEGGFNTEVPTSSEGDALRKDAGGSSNCEGGQVQKLSPYGEGEFSLKESKEASRGSERLFLVNGECGAPSAEQHEEKCAAVPPVCQQDCEPVSVAATSGGAKEAIVGEVPEAVKPVARSPEGVEHKEKANGHVQQVAVVKCEPGAVNEECQMGKAMNVEGDNAVGEAGSDSQSLCRNGYEGKPAGGLQHPTLGAARADPLAYLAVDCHLARPEGITPQTPLPLEAVSQRSSPSSVVAVEAPHNPSLPDSESLQPEDTHTLEKVANEAGQGYGIREPPKVEAEDGAACTTSASRPEESNQMPEIKPEPALPSASSQPLPAPQVGRLGDTVEGHFQGAGTSGLHLGWLAEDQAFQRLRNEEGGTSGALDDVDADMWGDVPAPSGPSSLPVCTLNRADTEIPTIDELPVAEAQMEHYPGIIPVPGHIPQEYTQAAFVGAGGMPYIAAPEHEMAPMDGVETAACMEAPEPQIIEIPALAVPQGEGMLQVSQASGERASAEWEPVRGGCSGAGIVEGVVDGVCVSGGALLLGEQREVLTGEAMEGEQRPGTSGVGAAKEGDGDEEEEEEGDEDDDDELPSFSDIESMVLDMDLAPRAEGEISAQRESRSLYRKHRRSIVRLEQAANAKVSRTLTKKRALAVLCGMTSRYYVKKPEVIVGRATMDVSVDIDLGLETRSNKVSRKQARIKMKESGVFCLENLGKKEIIVNNKSLQPRDRSILRNNSLIEVGGLRFTFEINHRLMRQGLFRSQTPEEDAEAKSS